MFIKTGHLSRLAAKEHAACSFTTFSYALNNLSRLLGVQFAEPVNLGNPYEIPLIQVANRILELVQSKSRIIQRELPPDDPKVRRPDITRAREILGWEPRVELDEGLALTLPYFQSEVNSSH